MCNVWQKIKMDWSTGLSRDEFQSNKVYTSHKYYVCILSII
jgi:hypothetical protein